MEHQTAVTYGNHFTNGYLGRDWTGVGISPRFDFIIIHESAHEWFGNAITAADRSDMWIHEGWATYLESLYVEYRWGKADGLKYLNGYKPKVQNRQPIVAQRGVNATPPEDQYFKGALFINTIRSLVNDDAKWFALPPRLLSAIQVSEHHDRGRGAIFQRKARHGPYPRYSTNTCGMTTCRCWNCDSTRPPALWPTVGRRTRPLSQCPSAWELPITGRSSNQPLPGRS